MKTRIYYNMGMQNKSSNMMALLFVLLVAAVLAAFCTLLFVAGRTLYKGVSKKKTPAPVVTQTPPPAPVQAPVVPFVAMEEPPENPLPPEVEEEPTYSEVENAAPEVCPATAVPVKVSRKKHKQSVTPYHTGLRACQEGGIFPCAWEDSSRGMLRQYWLMSAQGPVQRGIYDRAGNLVHETIAQVSGTVTSYTEQDTTYYFEGGVLVKIRTSPYDNCNLHDWFFINAQGKQDVCQCAYNQADCCARSAYKEGGPRTYCGINPLDRDFCK